MLDFIHGRLRCTDDWRSSGARRLWTSPSQKEADREGWKY